MLLGDQVYVDEVENLWRLPLDLNRAERRRRIAEVYHRFWSRAPVAEILANVPTYMMWDDHEIRNGWGSDPGDSPTLAHRYPSGRPISARYEAFFEDARQVYWHFQHVRNPATAGVDGTAFLKPGTRRAVPFAFACGATTLLVLDNRGARDVWRRRQPVLGGSQWSVLRNALHGLDTRTDSLVVVVPLPVISMPNRGIIQVMFGRRRDDVRLFRQGQAAKLKQFPEQGEPTSGRSKLLVYLQAAIDVVGALMFGRSGTGRFHLKDLTDVRDNWANHLVRRERDALLHAVLRVRRDGRAISFIGGDLHVGARMDIVERGGGRVPTLITSGIGQTPSAGPVVYTILGRRFRIARGLRARLVEHCVAHNFGLTRIRRDHGAAEITHELVHKEFERMIANLMTWLGSAIVTAISAGGYAGVAALMALESACVPLPSEIIMPFSGYLVSTGRFGLLLVVTAGAAGCNIGSAIAYEVGARGGRRLAKRWGAWLLISSAELEWAEGWFERRGSITVLLGRMLPVVRTFIALPAGIARMNRVRFHVYTFVGSWLWCLALAYIGMKLGESWNSDPRLKLWMHRFDFAVGAAIVVATGTFIWSRFPGWRRR